MSSWLVIGASSFTGSHFCRYLRERGEEVYPERLRNTLLFDVVQHGGFDCVANFAALNVVAPSWEHAEDYLRVNVQEPMLIWDICARRKLRYLHVSTPEVYGSTTGWITEDAPYNPSTPYAASRSAAEMLLKCYHRQYGLPVVFTRACNVYGPGQQLYRLIPKLIHCIKSGKRFPLEGGGLSARAFLHVEDVCAAYYLAATKGEPGQAYHVSGRGTQTIRNVARMVCTVMRVKPEDVIEETPERPGKDAAYYLNDTKIRALGWQDHILMPDGIRSVVDWIEREWETLKDASTEYEFKP